jgi:hypothetical protein
MEREINEGKSRELNLESFVGSYVEEALKLAQNNLYPSLESFDKSLRKSLSDKFKIDEEVILYIHHSFHWEFFLKNNNSPFEFLSSNKKGEVARVKLKRKVFFNDYVEIKQYILKNYRSYISERLFKKYNINTLPL